MFWFVYTIDEEGRLMSLRVRESEERPTHALVLNDGFKSPQEGLALMGHYLQVNQDGFVHVDRERNLRPIVWVERIWLAYTIEPRLAWLTVAALLLGVISLCLIVLHILGG